MRGILFAILEINIGISVIVLITLLFIRKLRKRYGAGAQQADTIGGKDADAVELFRTLRCVW